MFISNFNLHKRCICPYQLLYYLACISFIKIKEMNLIFSFFFEILQKSSPFGFRLQQIVSSDLNTHTNKKRQINQTLQCKLCKKRKAERQNTISVVQSFSLKVEKKDFFQCFSSILQLLQFQLLSLELKKKFQNRQSLRVLQSE